MEKNKSYFKLFILATQGQEVEFHEIEIQLFQEVKFLIMRSKLCLFMRSNLSNNIDQEVDTSIMRSKLNWSVIRQFRSHDQFVSCKYDHEIEWFYAQMANN